jgi:hypothetical protein
MALKLQKSTLSFLKLSFLTYKTGMMKVYLAENHGFETSEKYIKFPET